MKKPGLKFPYYFITVGNDPFGPYKKEDAAIKYAELLSRQHPTSVVRFYKEICRAHAEPIKVKWSKK